MCNSGCGVLFSIRSEHVKLTAWTGVQRHDFRIFKSPAIPTVTSSFCSVFFPSSILEAPKYNGNGFYTNYVFKITILNIALSKCNELKKKSIVVSITKWKTSIPFINARNCTCSQIWVAENHRPLTFHSTLVNRNTASNLYRFLFDSFFWYTEV